ncbi:MAG: class II fructose-bisphosphate aldolase family protein [Rickettsiales bacterium]|jgi:fructose-bisphosphate aldolase class II|nr:class II fructose-bisphosphate aldolase family protein [Rickettsiales bacterium]
MKNLLNQVLRRNSAVPAFNFYNLESFHAISAAARETGRPVIFAASESAIRYMGDAFLRDFAVKNGYVHLDHGRSFEAVKRAVALGFQSVMFDGSMLPFDENVRLTRRAADYARRRGVWIEAELGVLCGTEDGVRAPHCGFTDPAQAKKFVELTGCDSLALAIGTSHGAHKGNGRLRFDILAEVRRLLPKTPLVLHGASQIPKKYARVLGLKDASGIPAAEIKKAVALGINKVNVDSDARLAWMATVRRMFSDQFAVPAAGIDPRRILSAATDEMTKLYVGEIRLICGK